MSSLRPQPILRWYNQHVTLPLTIALCIVLALLGIFLGKTWLQHRAQDEAALSRAATLASMAITQKNRILLESVIENTHLQLMSEYTALCEGNRSLFTMGLLPTGVLACGDSQTDKTALAAPVSGFAQYKIVSKVPTGRMLGEISFLASIAAIFALMSVFLAWRWANMLRNQLVFPLKEGLYGRDALPIHELNELRNQIKSFELARTQTAIADAVIQKSHQVAHDIRSPLMVLGMFASTVGPKLAPEDKELLLIAVSRTREIADTLAKAGVKEHMGEFNNEPLLLTDVLSPVLKEKKIATATVNPNIEIKEVLHTEHDLKLKIDGVELRRAVANVINNAVEALPAGSSGTVTLKTDITPGKKLLLSISDNGRGMDNNTLRNIGARGFTHGKAGGTGLGLWHARELLARNGGELIVKSTQGVGTTVTFCLPVA